MSASFFPEPSFQALDRWQTGPGARPWPIPDTSASLLPGLPQEEGQECGSTRKGRDSR